MELELGLGLPNRARYSMGLDLNCGHNNNNNNNNSSGLQIGKKNREFPDDDGEVESKGLSLLLWSGHEDDDDDDEDRSSGKSRSLHVNSEEIDDEIEGWPPISSLRKEFLQDRHPRRGGWMANHAKRVRRSSMYVKVKMEGMPIGRKIDIRPFNSHRALTDTLIDMFPKYNKSEDYTILYQDKEGDWMLAGDSPWESFVECVQRMEIVRKNN